MKKSEKINIVFSSIGLIMGIVAIVISIKAINSNESIAERSGNFDRPEINFEFGNFIISQSDDTIPIIFGIDFEPESKNLCWLPFSLANIGKKDIEGLKFIIEYPSIAELALDHKYLKFETPSFASLNRTYEKINDYDMITYASNTTNPGLGMNINEPIVLRNTEVSTIVQGISIKTTYSLIINTTILGKDMMPRSKKFSFTCVNAVDDETLVSTFIKNIKRVREKSQTFFFVMPDKGEQIETPNGRFVQYEIENKNLHCAIIQDTSPNQDMIVTLYDMNNSLDKIMVFNKNNDLIKTMPVTK